MNIEYEIKFYVYGRDHGGNNCSDADDPEEECFKFERFETKKVTKPVIRDPITSLKKFKLNNT